MLAFWIGACLRACTIVCDLGTELWGAGIFPFETLQDGLIRVKQGNWNSLTRQSR